MMVSLLRSPVPEALAARFSRIGVTVHPYAEAGTTCASLCADRRVVIDPVACSLAHRQALAAVRTRAP